MMNGLYGTSMTVDDLIELGKKVLCMEHKLNEAAGFTNIYDRLPDWI